MKLNKHVSLLTLFSGAFNQPVVRAFACCGQDNLKKTPEERMQRTYVASVWWRAGQLSPERHHTDGQQQRPSAQALEVPLPHSGKKNKTNIISSSRPRLHHMHTQMFCCCWLTWAHANKLPKLWLGSQRWSIREITELVSTRLWPDTFAVISLLRATQQGAPCGYMLLGKVNKDHNKAYSTHNTLLLKWCQT